MLSGRDINAAEGFIEDQGDDGACAVGASLLQFGRQGVDDESAGGILECCDIAVGVIEDVGNGECGVAAEGGVVSLNDTLELLERACDAGKRAWLEGVITSKIKEDVC